MNDCNHCGQRNVEKGLPHRYDCPGLEIEQKSAKIKSLEAAVDSYMNAYFNMRDFAIEQGLDVTCYHSPAPEGLSDD